jgi:hypothetical protein
MNRGPVPNSRPAVSFAAKVRETWPTPTPDWIVELSNLADREGLGGAGKAIGYSRSAVSTVLANKYRGDVHAVELKVRGALMAETVECPVLGPIGRDHCLDEQKEPFRATSGFRARLYQACRGGCPNARRKDGDK